ncbi:hypothetical protein E2C01_070779 [Portunus trituberculatus]|uniref:Uncharacterized protein n=1 Tax=Portunus trituberculatus TaxID=210409 RepID=A0A5B7I376_PORTR|nr:hypothetical protein [Portunus trituberculatus]
MLVFFLYAEIFKVLYLCVLKRHEAFFGWSGVLARERERKREELQGGEEAVRGAVPHNPLPCHVENRPAILKSPPPRTGHQVLPPLWPRTAASASLPLLLHLLPVCVLPSHPHLPSRLISSSPSSSSSSHFLVLFSLHKLPPVGGHCYADDPAWPVPASLLLEGNYPAADDRGSPRPTLPLTVEISP